MRFKASLLLPEVLPYAMHCFQIQGAYKRSPASPDDAKQAKEMTNIPIRCLNHFKIYFNPSNSERIHLIQNDSIQFRESSPVLYSFCLSGNDSIRIRFTPFNSKKVHPYCIHSGQMTSSPCIEEMIGFNFNSL